MFARKCVCYVILHTNQSSLFQFRKNKGTGDVQPFRWPHWRAGPELLTLCSQRGSSLYSDRGWWFPSEALKAPYYTHFSFVMSLRERDVTHLSFLSPPWWGQAALVCPGGTVMLLTTSFTFPCTEGKTQASRYFFLSLKISVHPCLLKMLLWDCPKWLYLRRGIRWPNTASCTGMS